MNIYFSGIGGVGIGPLAEIAHDAGYEVAGSDPIESLTTRELRQKNIYISSIQDGESLKKYHEKKPIDWLVHTSAITEKHPEIVMARQLGIKISKRDELLARIISDKKLKLIAVAGTHGKTTTTGMLIWIMQQLHIPVSYSIGTTLSFGPSGKFDPASQYFVYECDEFDRNFLHFNPYLALITAIGYDHSDAYPTESDYQEAFRQFANNSAHAISWNDQNAELFANMPQVNLVKATSVDQGLPIAGAHNRRNATLVRAALDYLGIESNLNDLLIGFPGTDRRFEKLATNLYSDYGHHPTEIAATMQLAKELSNHVVLVYQPHQNIRQHELKDQYTDQFELADEVFWLPTYLSREDPKLAILEPSELIKNITNVDKVHIADFDDELWGSIQKARQAGKLVLGMGAGKIDGWLRERLSNDDSID